MDNIPFETPRTLESLQPPFGMHHEKWLEARRELALKKSRARKLVKRIAKNGVNEEQGYSFVEAADVYDLMRPILAECYLGFEVEYMNKRVERSPGTSANITDVDLLITFMDLETGYFEQKVLNATGLDHGDKGIYKAYTSGEKYALIMEFMIPTGSDAEGSKSAKEQEQIQQPNKEPSEPPVTPMQIGHIKTKILQLSKEPGESVEMRTRRAIGLYSSLASKLKVESLNEELLTTLTEGQGEIALQNLDEWLEKRKQLAERKGANK